MHRAAASTGHAVSSVVGGSSLSEKPDRNWGCLIVYATFGGMVLSGVLYFTTRWQPAATAMLVFMGVWALACFIASAFGTWAMLVGDVSNGWGEYYRERGMFLWLLGKSRPKPKKEEPPWR